MAKCPTAQCFLLKVRRRCLNFCAVSLLFAPSLAVSANATKVYTYPVPESFNDSRQQYPIHLLEYCAAKSNGEWQVQQSKLHMQQGRAIKQLQSAQGIDIIWTVTTLFREEGLQPIRVPIDRGLLGWRLLMINPAQEARFNAINQASELQALTAGQGHDWPDTSILRFNNYKVLGNASYEGLFDMVNLQHIDYFPRGVSEIFVEIDARKNKQLTFASGLALNYPTALYFFVNPQDALLKTRLTDCLTEAADSGTLKKMFYEHYGNDIAKADLKHKIIFTLANPLLSQETPINNKQWWFSPEESTQ